MTADTVSRAVSWEPVPGFPRLWRAVAVVEARDGARLVSDVYAGDPDPQARPVLLERTPYGRRSTRGSDAAVDGQDPAPPETVCARLVARGYVVVRQDCRGRGDSGGRFAKYVNEAEDGYDTVEWVARQPWCDGRVATMGVSYSAHTQTALASLAPPHLAAMFVDSGGFASAYETGVRMGGAFELKQATWALRRAREVTAADPVRAAALAAEPVEDWFRQLPWRRGHSPLRHLPDYEDYLFEQWENEDFGPFWQQRAIYGRGYVDRFPDVPSLHMSSWYDPYVRTAIENFTELGRRGDERTYLVLGPWTHGRRSDRFAGDVDFGDEAPLDGNLAPDYVEMRADWFDAQLSGEAGHVPPVRYFVMGGGSGRRSSAGRLEHGGRWRTARTWPPETTRPTRLYLHPAGLLAPERPGTTDLIRYDHDPADPVPTIGGQVTSGEPVMDGGAFDQRPGSATFALRPSPLPLAARPDVLVFQTEPLESGLVVAGPVTARLRVSSTAVDTDFTIKLIDVHPPSADYPAGFAMNLTEGILRCRYRDGFERPVPMEPGRPYDIEVSAPDTANYFAPGHRLRVDISSSNFPRFDVNPGTGRPPVAERRTVVATNTVHLGPSHIELWRDLGTRATTHTPTAPSTGAPDDH